MGMTNAVDQDSWTEISVKVNTADIDTAGDIANMVVPYGIYIEDYSALEEETMEIAHIDLIEESLLKKDRTKGIIHIYINPEENPMESVSFLKERLNASGIEHEITVSDCKVEDWQNNWKQYFHPMPIGEKLLIRPVWMTITTQTAEPCSTLSPDLPSARVHTRQQGFALKHSKDTLKTATKFWT